MKAPARRPAIGVFDSGFGGLTVLKQLVALLPDADYLYFGDTARLPYGSKSVETVARYAVEATHFLERQGANLLVIACNTATALALEQSRPPLPARTGGWLSSAPKRRSVAMRILKRCSGARLKPVKKRARCWCR